MYAHTHTQPTRTQLTCIIYIYIYTHIILTQYISGWWFGTCFIFANIGNNHPSWLIFFRGVAQPPTIYIYIYIKMRPATVTSPFINLQPLPVRFPPYVRRRCVASPHRRRPGVVCTAKVAQLALGDRQTGEEGLNRPWFHVVLYVFLRENYGIIIGISWDYWIFGFLYGTCWDNYWDN